MQNDIYFNQIRVFQAIAETGSIVGAAKALGISSPAVSKALKLLEQRVGTHLFQRTTRSIALTETGEKLLSQTQGALQTLADALDSVRDDNGEPSGVVRITLSRVAYQLVLQDRLAEFQTQYPEIELEISVNDGLVDLVADGFDLGVRLGHSLAQGVVARELFPAVKMGLYASTSYVEKYGKPKNWRDLAEHRLVAYRFSSTKRLSPVQLQVGEELVSVNMKTALITNDMNVVQDAVLQGVAIGQLFDACVQQLPDHKRSNFVEILPKHWQPFPPLYLYYLKNEHRPKRIQAVVDFLIGK